MLQHREIQNFEVFQKSIRNFADFYPRLKGASDVDFFYERNGHFLILEDKEYFNNELKLYYGEIKALKTLIDLSGCIKGYIIAHHEDTYKMINFDEIKMNCFAPINKIWMQYFNVSDYVEMTKQEMIETVGQICDSFETFKKSKRKSSL